MIGGSGFKAKTLLFVTSLVGSTSQLQDHMDRSSRTDIVGLQGFVVRQLLSRMDQSNLVDLDTLLFLQGLLHRQHLVFWLEIEGLFTAGQSFDENLRW
jgi:hypothetical protein